MKLQEIENIQKAYNVSETQKMISNGSIWKFEGSMGRFAMSLLDSGVCFLPDHNTSDYYGTIIPSREVLEDGTKGTIGNCSRFWGKVNEGNFECIEYLEESF